MTTNPIPQSYKLTFDLTAKVRGHLILVFEDVSTSDELARLIEARLATHITSRPIEAEVSFDNMNGTVKAGGVTAGVFLVEYANGRAWR